MERLRVAFTDAGHPERSGALVLDDDGRVFLRVSPALAGALHAAIDDPATDLAPLRFDDRRRGLTLAASLAKGVAASLLEFDLASGAFELRAHLGRARVRLILKPGDFDPDAAWGFLVAANDATLEAPPA